MGFGFSKRKRSRTAAEAAATDMTTTLDESGNMEIVSKNFKMKATQKPADDAGSSGDTWICWGCGQPTGQDICPVCGKKKN